mmetsp:Transcript_11462/g.22784  ORF Transcript_11462/g.22784 Transcript_11462/m.22784 type:complete len:263 (+) Transcript_11462:318-1106(+)
MSWLPKCAAHSSILSPRSLSGWWYSRAISTELTEGSTAIPSPSASPLKIRRRVGTVVFISISLSLGGRLCACRSLAKKLMRMRAASRALSSMNFARDTSSSPRSHAAAIAAERPSMASADKYGETSHGRWTRRVMWMGEMRTESADTRGPCEGGSAVVDRRRAERMREAATSSGSYGDRSLSRWADIMAEERAAIRSSETAAGAAAEEERAERRAEAGRRRERESPTRTRAAGAGRATDRAEDRDAAQDTARSIVGRTGGGN